MTMTPGDLKAFRSRYGLSQHALALELGVSRSRLADFEAGKSQGHDRPAPIPKLFELACEALITPGSRYQLGKLKTSAAPNVAQAPSSMPVSVKQGERLKAR
jgi:transcriptional regulator with XRE-family HTH domain